MPGRPAHRHRAGPDHRRRRARRAVSSGSVDYLSNYADYAGGHRPRDPRGVARTGDSIACDPMDLSFTDEERAFAAEFRAWLDDQPRAAAGVRLASTTRSPGVAKWQAKLAADRWVGIHWPSEFGGRSASPVQVAIYNLEYGRSRALQLVNRTGVNLAGPTLLAHGTEEQKAALAAVDPQRRRDLVPAVLRARGRLRPRRPADHARRRSRAAGCSTARRCGPATPSTRAGGSASPAPTPSCPKHKGISYLVVDMEADGVEIRPLAADHRRPEFNEVFFDDVFVPENHLVGGLNHGLGGRQHDARARAGHHVPVQGAGRARGVPRRPLPTRRRGRAARRADAADALAQSFVELRVLRLHNWRTLSRLAEGHRARARSRAGSSSPGPT